MITREALVSLPPRQREVLDAVVCYYRTTREPCPGSYLARKLHVHHRTIGEHLAALHRKGWLKTANAPATPTRW